MVPFSIIEHFTFYCPRRAIHLTIHRCMRGSTGSMKIFSIMPSESDPWEAEMCKISLLQVSLSSTAILPCYDGSMII